MQCKKQKKFLLFLIETVINVLSLLEKQAKLLSLLSSSQILAVLDNLYDRK